MKFFNYLTLILLSFFIFSCGNSVQEPSLSNVEKAYQATMQENVDAYCNCIDGYVKYIKSKADVKDIRISAMGKKLNKIAQKCVQNSDKDNQDIQALASSLSLIDRKMYNSQFTKKFQEQCPDNAAELIGIWGGVGPLPTIER